MAASDPGRQRVLKDLLESYQHSFKYTKAQGQGLRPSLSDMSELCTFRVASPLCALAAAAVPRSRSTALRRRRRRRRRRPPPA